MAIPTRTFGPLHFEDLEPHRFEDLVRQLAYDFKPWHSIEATGRAGADRGFDVRAHEALPNAQPKAEDDDDVSEVVATRLWVVQCKREKSIGPKKLADFLDEIQLDKSEDGWGIIFAASCNFSLSARDTFRAKARELGFSEAHLWGKGELEDALFQPKNDHLLFAYMGISLQARRRSARTEIRSRLTMKRKTKKLITPMRPVLVRDVTDDRYPYMDSDKTKSLFERRRWKVYSAGQCKHDGLHLLRQRHFAFLDDDDEHWDFAETMNDAEHSRYEDPWSNVDGNRIDQARVEAMALWEALPEQNRAWFEHHIILPYENILDIDEDGDEIFRNPHIFVSDLSGVPPGPFRRYGRTRVTSMSQFNPRKAYAEPEKRVEKFPRKPTGAKA